MSDKPHDNLLSSTAKAIGATAGKIASLVGASGPAPAHKHAKLAKKNKQRLPRRMKKAQKKAAAQSRS